MDKRVLRGMACLALPVAAGAGFLAGRAGQNELPPAVVVLPDEAPQIDVVESHPPTPTAAVAPEIMLTVTGAVRRPGVYSLPQDARVNDALDAAGGVPLAGVLDNINIAAPLVDGSVLTVPQFDESLGHGVPPAAQSNPPVYTRTGWQAQSVDLSVAASAPLDINSASQNQLETLPGIGPVTAKKIITFRQSQRFTQIEDLTQVSGIGEKTLENLRPFVTVR